MARTKSVIVVEDRLKEMFDTLPTITNSTGQVFKPQFRYGDGKELVSYLNKTETDYPMIWLEYPYTESHKINKVELNGVSLILAVSSNAVMYNPERIEETFKQFLLPLWNCVIETFRRSNTIDTLDEYSLVKHPNYNTTANQNQATVIWDAIKVTFDTKINSDCLRIAGSKIVPYNTFDSEEWSFDSTEVKFNKIGAF